MKSIGTLADITTSPQVDPKPDNTQAQIDTLTRRVSTLENLLADVMHHLDQPYRNRNIDGKLKPKPPTKGSERSSDKDNSAPFRKVQKKAPPQPIEPKEVSNRKADMEAATAFLKKYPNKLWHGKTLRQELKNACEGLSNARLKTVINTLRKDDRLNIVKNVEVDGEILKGAYQYTP